MPKAYGFMMKKLRTSFKDFISRQQSTIATDQAPVVQTLDSAIHWKNHYPLDNSIGFARVYPLDSDLSGGCRAIHRLNNWGQVCKAFPHLSAK